MATLQQLLDDIDARLPNTFTATQKITWMNDCVGEVWRYMASTKLHTTVTVSSQANYELPTGIEFDKIKRVEVANSTAGETFNEYTYKGDDDTKTDYSYLKNVTTDGTRLQLYPTPDTADYPIKIKYEAKPTVLSTNTLSTGVQINSEYQDILKFRAMKVIAQSGNSPDVELANNYFMEELEILRKIRTDYYKRKQKLPKSRFDYRQNWYKG